ncbi:MAG: beta-lactamase family protein [Bacteroidetes bacterium]|nr:beta-lactamase family protein [Bacteroidota bacterium]
MADSIRQFRRIPGLVYAVLNSDSILLKEGVGYRQFRTKDTISLNNRFHLGSATAAFTSFIASQLVAKGKLNWNTPLLKLVPAAAARCRPEFRGVTLADLLSQQAGLLELNEFRQIYSVPVFQGKPVQQRIAFVQWAVEKRGSSKDTTGKKYFHFSNANTVAAVAMLEKASGLPWEELLKQYVNKPLGINIKTGWPVEISPAEPWGHWMENDRYVPTGPDYWFHISPVLTGAGDANITIADYCRFVQDELRGIRGEKALLTPRQYELMHYVYPGYSFGWTNLEVNGTHISECDGTMGTFFSHVVLLKEKNLAIIVLCNSGDTGGRGAAINLARELLQRYTSL